MAATGVQCYFVYSLGVYGFSETFVLASRTDLSDVTVNLALNLAKARLKTCGPPVQFYSLRLRLLGGVKRYRIVTAPALAGSNPVSGTVTLSDGSTQSNNADPVKSCILVRMEAGDTNRKALYMAGIPDAIMRTNPDGPDIGLGTSWLPLYQAWRNILINGTWGFIGQKRDGASTPVAITAVAEDLATNNVVLTVPGLPAPPFAGAKLIVRGNRRTKSFYRGINGVQVVLSSTNLGTGAATVTLAQTADIDISKFRVLGNAAWYDFTTSIITDVAISKQTAHHRSGRFLTPRANQRRPLRV